MIVIIQDMPLRPFSNESRTLASLHLSSYSSSETLADWSSSVLPVDPFLSNEVMVLTTEDLLPSPDAVDQVLPLRLCSSGF